MGRVRFFGNPAYGSIRIADYANILDGETIVIGNKTYEWDDDDDVVVGRVKVTIGGSDAASVTALIAAINANKPTPGVTAYVDPVDTKLCRLVCDKVGTAGNMALTESTVDADAVTVSGATLVGGENGGSQREGRGAYTVTAQDVSAANIVIPVGFDSPRFVLINVKSSDGLHKANLSGLQTVSGSKIVLDNSSGAVHLVAGDIITWFAHD